MNEQEKLGFLKEHFLYEYTMMLLGLDLILKENEQQNPNQLMINAGIELVLLHSRNLFEFYICRKKYNTDARIGDFLPESNALVVPNIRDVLKEFIPIEEKDRMNTELSHLTYLRIKCATEEKKWELSHFIASLFRAGYSFLDALPKETKENLLVEYNKLFDKYEKMIGKIKKENNGFIIIDGATFTSCL